MTDISRSDKISTGRDLKPLNAAEYKALAEFRYQLRKFLRNTEERVRAAGLNPQQYQLLLAIRGLPSGVLPTVGTLAERMQLNHNSMVELVDRCEGRGLIRRTRSGSDRRRVTLSITPEGEDDLRKLASASRHELSGMGSSLVEAILSLTQGPSAEKKSRKSEGAKKSEG
jgi:DNA-binding MarR family transcriptional regulator